MKEFENLSKNKQNIKEEKQKTTHNHNENFKNIDQHDAKDLNIELKDDKEIEELTQKNQDLEKKLLLVAADFANTRKRLEKEIEQVKMNSIGKIIQNTIHPIDMLDMAILDAENSTNDINIKFQNLLQGLKMVHSEFSKILEDNKVEKIIPNIGDLLEAKIHEGVSHVKSDIEAGRIASIIRCGYKIGDNIIRSAMVAVSDGNK